MAGQRAQVFRQVAPRRGAVLRVVSETKTASAPVNTVEYLEVTLQKPLGVRFGKGNDGGAYVLDNNPQAGYTDDRIQVGDKVVQVSASFGDDVWDAKGFGQTIYAIKTRNGAVYLKLEKRNGDTSCFEEDDTSEAERMFKAERAGGNVGSGTREVQTRNYIMRKELERKRRELFDDALTKFRGGNAEDALIIFEEVVGMEPTKVMTDNFARRTEVYRVTQYNIACCYASVGNIDAALEALETTLDAGFENFALVRKDKSLAPVREDPRFTKLINKYDEPWINTDAIDAVKNLFNFGKK